MQASTCNVMAPRSPTLLQAISKDSEEDPDDDTARRNDKKRKGDERVSWLSHLRVPLLRKSLLLLWVGS